MALSLWQALVEAVDSAVQVTDTAKARRHSRLGPAFGLAAAGFLTLLSLGRFLESSTLMAFSVLPPALAAIWGARRAWISDTGRKPFLCTSLVLTGVAGVLYAAPFLGGEQSVLSTFAGSLFLGSVAAAAVAMLLAILAYLRGEWPGL